MSKFNIGDFIRVGFGEYTVMCIEEDRSSLTLSQRDFPEVRIKLRVNLDSYGREFLITVDGRRLYSPFQKEVKNYCSYI